MRVFVLDKNQQPLDPCHPARARELLRKGRAAIFKCYPLTIILKDRTIEDSVVYVHRIKIDPGSRCTGMAVVNDQTGRVTSAFEITHRGFQIKKSLESRRQLRRGRRARKTRYRRPPKHEWSRKGKKFKAHHGREARKPVPKQRRVCVSVSVALAQRCAAQPLALAVRSTACAKRVGWLPPSLESRIANIETWVRRIRKLCPISAISQELVRFDTQALANPEISGIEYQRGELFGFEVKEYLLIKWGRQCVYCNAENIQLEIEHILAKSKGGSNRVSNLTLACRKCNKKKGNQPIEQFLKKKSDLLKRILAQAKAPLRDATAVNATRWELYRRLQSTGLPVEVGSGGLTKFNRVTRGIDKQHWTDAANTGKSTPQKLLLRGVKPLLIAAKGHGVRQRCRPDKHGFPQAHAPKAKFFQGFQTGDIVKASIPKGKYAGNYTGRIAIRFRPSFKLQVKDKDFDVHPKYLKTIHKADGYEYQS